MSRFTKTVAHVLTFEGDEVSMHLARLKRKDMQQLMPYLTPDGDNVKLSFQDQAQFSNVTIAFLPSYVSNFSGLKDADGIPIPFEDVLVETYFNDIVTSIISRLFEVSRLSADESGNSDAPPVIDMTGSASAIPPG